MTRSINLLSLIQAHRSLDQGNYERYAASHGIAIRPKELNDLHSLAEQLRDAEPNDRLFDQFHVGYQIPQIGKEFDLLRFGENHHINIEVKADCDLVKIERQLRRNKYYLGFLGKDVYCVSYSSLAQQFFVLDGNDTAIEIDTKEVKGLLASQVIDEATPIAARFNPSNYLVSPFNSPSRFLLGKYFLTSQQEDVKRQALALLASGTAPVFVALSGAAGTGKTLLSYDIVAELKRIGRTPLIVHCGKLNSGHWELMNAGWHIIAVKDIARTDLGSFSPILLDEAQRIRPGQFNSVVEQITSKGGKCIFSYDRSQTLDDYETKNDIATKIATIPGIVTFSLSEKIRTNKEIADFIKSFVKADRQLKVSNTGNVEVTYFNKQDDAVAHLASLEAANWKVIKFTPSQYNREHHETYSAGIPSTSHDVIGQEFEHVAVMVDQFFSYNARGDLVYTGKAYYQPAKMLFQNMTRARSKLRIIIINNPAMLSACMKILG